MRVVTLRLCFVTFLSSSFAVHAAEVYPVDEIPPVGMSAMSGTSAVSRAMTSGVGSTATTPVAMTPMAMVSTEERQKLRVILALKARKWMEDVMGTDLSQPNLDHESREDIKRFKKKVEELVLGYKSADASSGEKMEVILALLGSTAREVRGVWEGEVGSDVENVEMQLRENGDYSSVDTGDFGQRLGEGVGVVNDGIHDGLHVLELQGRLRNEENLNESSSEDASSIGDDLEEKEFSIFGLPSGSSSSGTSAGSIDDLGESQDEVSDTDDEDQIGMTEGPIYPLALLKLVFPWWVAGRSLPPSDVNNSDVSNNSQPSQSQSIGDRLELNVVVVESNEATPQEKSLRPPDEFLHDFWVEILKVGDGRDRYRIGCELVLAEVAEAAGQAGAVGQTLAGAGGQTVVPGEQTVAPPLSPEVVSPVLGVEQSQNTQNHFDYHEMVDGEDIVLAITRSKAAPRSPSRSPQAVNVDSFIFSGGVFDSDSEADGLELDLFDQGFDHDLSTQGLSGVGTNTDNTDHDIADFEYEELYNPDELEIMLDSIIRAYNKVEFQRWEEEEREREERKERERLKQERRAERREEELLKKIEATMEKLKETGGFESLNKLNDITALSVDESVDEVETFKGDEIKERSFSFGEDGEDGVVDVGDKGEESIEKGESSSQGSTEKGDSVGGSFVDGDHLTESDTATNSSGDHSFPDLLRFLAPESPPVLPRFVRSNRALSSRFEQGIQEQSNPIGSTQSSPSTVVSGGSVGSATSDSSCTGGVKVMMHNVAGKIADKISGKFTGLTEIIKGA